jgi:hypothetical protein
MATIITTLRVIDRFSKPLLKAQMMMADVAATAKQLRRELETPITIRFDPDYTVRQARALRSQIEKQLGNITVKANVKQDGKADSDQSDSGGDAKNGRKGRRLGPFEIPDGLFDVIRAAPALYQLGQSLMSNQTVHGQMSNAELAQATAGAAAAAVEESAGGLLGKMREMVGELFSMENAKKLWEASVGGAMEEESLRARFVGRTGSAEVGGAMFDKFREEALKAGADVGESLKNALSFFSVTQNSGHISELNRLAGQLAAFDMTGGGITDAAEALKAAYAGDVDALSEKYAIPQSAIDAEAFTKMGEAGNMSGFIEMFDKMLEEQNLGREVFQAVQQTAAYQTEQLRNNLQASMAQAGRGGRAGAYAAHRPV